VPFYFFGGTSPPHRACIGSLDKKSGSSSVAKALLPAYQGQVTVSLNTIVSLVSSFWIFVFFSSQKDGLRDCYAILQ